MTDEQLVRRIGGFRKLTLIDLRETAVTQEGVKRIAEALPGCEIHWDGGVIEPTLQERKAAEWILSVGGTFDVAGGSQVHKVEDLPKGPFRIFIVYLRGIRLKDADLEQLRGLTRLVHLDLMDTGIGNAALTHLESITTLENIILTGTNVSAAAVDSLKKLPALRYVEVGATKFRPGQYQRLMELPAIRQIGLGSDSDFGDEEAKSLHKLPTVEALMVSHSALGDTGLGEVAKLTQLRALSLESCPRVTNEGMAALASLTKLRELYVGHTLLRDEGVATIAGLTELEKLMADETEIGDAGVQHLAKARKLKFLTLQRTKVTEAGIKVLHKELPECRIHWDGGVVEPAPK
jgi:hypothetical protein